MNKLWHFHVSLLSLFPNNYFEKDFVQCWLRVSFFNLSMSHRSHLPLIVSLNYKVVVVRECMVGQWNGRVWMVIYVSRTSHEWIMDCSPLEFRKKPSRLPPLHFLTKEHTCNLCLIVICMINMTIITLEVNKIANDPIWEEQEKFRIEFDI